VTGDVTVTTNVQGMVDRMAETARRTLHDAIGDEVTATYKDAQTGWPVKTGNSRNSMSLQVTGSGDARRWVVKVSAFYAALIQQKGREPTYVGQRLLIEPMHAAAARAMKRTADRLAGKG
jgi:hypothetical protein